MKTVKKFAILGLVLMVFSDASSQRPGSLPPEPPQGQDQLPPGWYKADFGDYSEPGTVLYDEATGRWTIDFPSISGPNSVYVYTFLKGAGQITARVHDIGAFVEIRESLDGSSKRVGVELETTVPSRVDKPFETYADASFYGTGTENIDKDRIVLPYWLRIERIGDTFTGYISSDGEPDSWVRIGSTTISMIPYTSYIGMGSKQQSRV